MDDIFRHKELINEYLRRSNGDYAKGLSDAVDRIAYGDVAYPSVVMSDQLGEQISRQIGTFNKDEILEEYKSRMRRPGVRTAGKFDNKVAVGVYKTPSGSFYDRNFNSVVIDDKLMKKEITPQRFAGVLDHEIGHATDFLSREDPAHSEQIFRQHMAPNDNDIERIKRFAQALDVDSLEGDDIAAAIKDGVQRVSPTWSSELKESGHHSNLHPDFIHMPATDQAKSWEYRSLLDRIRKAGGYLPSVIGGVASVSGVAGKAADYYEAQKDPNFTEEEKFLRAIDAVAPNEQTTRDIEYMKLMRDSLSA